MKQTFGFVAIAIAAVAGMAGCSAESEPTPKPHAAASTTASSTGSEATGVKDACEKFNSLYAEFGAIDPSDADAYDSVYLSADEAKASAPGDTAGLFAALSLLALERGSGEEPSADSQTALMDAVSANSAACTVEGVTLTL